MNIQDRTISELDNVGSLVPLIWRNPSTAFVEQLPIAVDGRMLRVNQKLCQLTGYSASELLGRTIFQETLPEDAVEDREQFGRQLAVDLEPYTIEKRIFRKDGEHFWASVTSSSIRDAAGKFLYAVRVQHDISDRKRTERALARRMEE